MAFSTMSFLVYFLPAAVIVYYLIPKRFPALRGAELLLASLVFCWVGGGLLCVCALCLCILVSYVCARLAEGKKKPPVIVAAAVLIGALAFFKYIKHFSGALAVAMPLGLSFFVFQALGYVIDVYRGTVPAERSLPRYALFMAMFPQLAQGPILRYAGVANDLPGGRATLDGFAAGLTRFCFGLAKKLLLANAMAKAADMVFGYEASLLPAGLAWVGALAYTLQIYLDFSAYSDMALGLGRLFGYEFPENFNYPYAAVSITDFWRRWHISLSSWFRDYVYIPLGGNRKGYARQIVNILIVWLLTGAWHGSTLNYIAWGLWFGVLIVLEKPLMKTGYGRLPLPVRRIVTMLLVILGRVLFRSPDLGYAWRYFLSMLGMGGGIESGAALYLLLEYWPEWICGLIACFPLKRLLEKKLRDRAGPAGIVYTWGPKAAALLLLALSYMKLLSGSFQSFIYFQF